MKVDPRLPLLPFVMFTLTCLVLATLPAPARKHDNLPSTGLRAIAYTKAPPDFAYDLGSGGLRLSSLFGRPIVLNFWASWCEPCQAELPAFVRLRATYGDAVPLLTLSAEAPGVARAFLQGRHVALPVVEDPARRIFDAYSVAPIPVTIVLARNGTVSHVSVGQLDWNELQMAIQAVIAAPPPEAPADGVRPPLPVNQS